MKMKTKIITIISLASLFVACTNVLAPEVVIVPSTKTLSATITQPSEENGTKTALDGSLYVTWSADDAIAVFEDGATSFAKYTSDNTGTGTTEATFSGDAVDAAYAYYPYKAVSAVDGSNNISVVIPRVQTYAANTFGEFNMPMLATVVADKLSFKNLMAVLKLQLTGTGTVSRIIVMSETATLSGKATVASDGTITFSTTDGDYYNWVELDCGAGVALSGSPTTFMIAVPAGDYDFTVRVASTASTVAPDKSVASAKTFTANKIKPMASYAVAFGGDVKYVDGAYIGDPVVITSAVDSQEYTWAPVNCGYNGQYTLGKYGKLFQYGRKYGQKTGATIAPTSEARTVADGSDIFNEFKYYSATYAETSKWIDSTPLYYSGGAKTAYDPCPVGWRVPSGDELKKLFGWTANGTRLTVPGAQRRLKVNGVWGDYYDGSTGWQIEERPASGLYIPCAGYRYRTSGNSQGGGNYHANICLGGNNGPQWVMIQSQTDSKDSGTTYKDNIQYFGSQAQAQGFSIRCIKE